MFGDALILPRKGPELWSKAAAEIPNKAVLQRED